MTVAVSWIRKVKEHEELVFIADSRLVGGLRWDECPKLTTLPGNTCVLAFAGATDYAYPMMMQIKQAMTGYEKIETRAMDIKDINGHVLNHANSLVQAIYDWSDPDDIYKNEFLFGGYSWQDKQFKIWRYHYSKFYKRFVKEGKQKRILPFITGDVAVIGDQRYNYKKELRSFLQEKYGDTNQDISVPLDMEPFEVLCRMLWRDDKEATIGGPPQMIKSYQYMNCRPVGVYWPEKKDDFSNRTMLGRKMFEYEDTHFWFIDPISLRTNACKKTNSSDDNSSM